MKMKHKLQIFVSASAASLVVLTAVAQDPVDSKPDNRRLIDNRDDRMEHLHNPHRLNGAAKASDILGMTIKNYQDEKLGKVEDFAVDVESGRIVQVIVVTGGILGIGETMVAVPPGAFHYDVAQKILHLDADKEKLKAAPKFEMSKWNDYGDSNHLAEVYRYYGEDSAFTFVHDGDSSLYGQRNPDGTPEPLSSPKASRYMAKADASERQSMIPVSRLSQVRKASKLMGTPVENLQDEKLGKVENILLDLAAGRVVAIVVSSGGFLGMGDELSAVPSAALRFNAERSTLQLDASKEMLSNAPHFKANQWPDFNQPSYAGGIYHAYHLEPYFTTNSISAPDNTARNARDRNSSSLTPLDQGNSNADIQTTAQIRKEIMAGKNMSVNAKNVKIITRDGQVTLRGTVNSAEEKRAINEIAERIAHSENVNNQLEVKLSTTTND